MNTSGTVHSNKRKLDESTLYDVSYEDQRQSILDISMCKLQVVPIRKVEPTLLRTVLIFNTLKFIEIELDNEGIKIPPTANPPSIIPSLEMDSISLDPPPNMMQVKAEAKYSTELEPLCDNNPIEGCSETEGVVMGPEQQMSEHLVPDAVTPSPNVPIDNLTYTFNKYNWNSILDDLNGVLNTQSKLDDLLGDMDIDSSLYDMELFSASSLKLTPLNPEELIHAFPAEYSTTYTSNSLCLKNDLLSDDLDHIMQILVGSS